MRLSEAIRLGSLLGPQLRHTFIQGQASCALGAAALALGCKKTDSRGVVDSIVAVFGPKVYGEIEAASLVEHGVTTVSFTVSLVSLISYMNDSIGYTREQIADWLVNSGKDLDSREPGVVNIPSWINLPAEEKVCV